MCSCYLNIENEILQTRKLRLSSNFPNFHECRCSFLGLRFFFACLFSQQSSLNLHSATISAPSRAIASRRLECTPSFTFFSKDGFADLYLPFRSRQMLECYHALLHQRNRAVSTWLCQRSEGGKWGTGVGKCTIVPLQRLSSIHTPYPDPFHRCFSCCCHAGCISPMWLPNEA